MGVGEIGFELGLIGFVFLEPEGGFIFIILYIIDIYVHFGSFCKLGLFWVCIGFDWVCFCAPTAG